MANHRMKFTSATSEMAVFECEECKRSIALHLPETGRVPAAVANGDTFDLPEGAMQPVDGLVVRNLGKCAE